MGVKRFPKWYMPNADATDVRTHYKTDSRLLNIRIVFLFVVPGESTVSYIIIPLLLSNTHQSILT